MCSVADPLDIRVRLPDGSLQPTVLRGSRRSLRGYSSRGHPHIELCFRMGVPPPSRPRLRQLNHLFCLQHGRCKGSLHIINTAAARGGGATSWVQIVPASSCRRWRTFVSRRQSIGGGGIFTLLTGRLRSMPPNNFTCASTRWVGMAVEGAQQ